MKRIAAIMLTAMMVFLGFAMAASAIDKVEVRGKVFEDDGTWTVQDFAGFYYDLKDDLGKEQIKIDIVDNVTRKIDEPNGVNYTTESQEKAFKYKGWGKYYVMGFLGEKYFVGYINDTAGKNDIPYEETTDKKLLANEQLSKVLTDDDTERTITSADPLKLGEGYELAIKSIDTDGNKAYVELSKDGTAIDKKIVSPSKIGATMADETYFYKKAEVGDSKKVVTIAVHFKNAFRSQTIDVASINGIWQISDTPVKVKTNEEFGKMRVKTIDAQNLPMKITLDNKDNQITLTKNTDVKLVSDKDGNDLIDIKVADNDKLRYYIFKTLTTPGNYEIRGQVFVDDGNWNTNNFAGFYYDLKDNLGKEQLKIDIKDVATRKIDEPNGVNYTTESQEKAFKYKGWGKYYVMGFLGEKYFAGYINDTAGKNDIPYEETTDKKLLANEQLSKVLTDDDTERTITSADPLKLGEGYELAIKSIDTDGNKAYLELSKDGKAIDNKIVSPSKIGATMADETYFYKKAEVGDSKKVVTIAVHFKNAFRSQTIDVASINGIWQISDTPVKVKTNEEFGKMRVKTVDAQNLPMKITLDNKDNQITLTKNTVVELMTDIAGNQLISVRVADNDKLRYYIFKPVTIEGAAPGLTTVPTPPPNMTNVTPPVTPGTTPITTPVNKTNVTPVTPPTPPVAKPPTPGFEGIFAITGLMAVAYLVLGRKK